MMQALWQIPLCVTGIHVFYRGAKLFFSDAACILGWGAALALGGVLVRNEDAPRRSWRGRLLYHATMAVVAVYLWSSFGK